MSSPKASFVPFTKAERIQQLNDIDKSIATLLQSAGLALQTLASSKTPSPTKGKREAFQKTSDAYLKTLHSVDVRLKRQIYGLEEANIILADKVKGKSDSGQPSGQVVDEGGLGKLDIGWLNSRSDKVGWTMEAELWTKAKVFIKAFGDSDMGATKDQDQDMKT